MKCPKCHREVEKGSLYCPHCLAEIPWVREFDSVETLLKKEQQRGPQKKEKIGKKRKQWKKKLKKKMKKKLSFSRKQIFLLLLLGLLLFCAVFYRKFHTFSHLYSYAEKQYELGNYEIAARFTDEALEDRKSTRLNSSHT